MSSPGIGVNPLIALGNLNRLRPSIVWASNASLNITASFIGRAGIRVVPQGDATTPLPVMTGVVQSPEPFIMVRIQVPLLKTQGLASLYKTQYETNSLMGDCTVRTDSSTLGPFLFNNCSIGPVGELNLAGETPDWGFEFIGTYLINSSLWSAA